MKQKITTEIWIERAKAVHGDLYDYSESEYTKNNAKVKIICRKHGSFYQRASNHIAKHYGCPICKGEKNSERYSYTKEQFIEKAIQIHGTKYDYSKVEYKNNQTKVCIICPEHGEFWQTPSIHTNICNKSGCPKCGRIKTANKRNNSVQKWIDKAVDVHGSKYNYDSWWSYKRIKATDKVKITCPIHGEFKQEVNNHVHGYGCYYCGQESTHEKQKISLEEFVQRANIIHNNSYDYSMTKYTSYHENIDIICKKHGLFKQTPATHLRGAGCPKCKRSRGEEIISCILDKMKVEYINQFKIKVNSDVRNECVVDFYLPNKNCVIEFHGIQHYKPIRFFGGEQQFKIQKLRDESLRQHCKQNNIQLIEIPYYENQIEEIIKNLLP